jgi:hypothetical protein
MALKNGIFTLALGALLMGSTAMAQDTYGHDDAQMQAFQAPPPGSETNAQGFHGGDNSGYRWDRERDDRERRRYRPGRVEAHVHSAYCNHSQQPQPPQYQQGRYELRYEQQWVPGYYHQVWVPQECKYKPRRGVTKCRDGYYEQQWVPGHYENVEKWVWVPSHHRRQVGPEWAPASNWH